MDQQPKIKLTMLSSMAGREFAESLDRQAVWGIQVLDLKDALFGKGLLDLTDAEVARAGHLIRQRGMTVYCLSTRLFHDEVEKGPEAFEAAHLARVPRAVEIARALAPTFIRLLAPKTRRTDLPDCTDSLRREHPWLSGMFGEAVDRIAEAGFRATIENETRGCILSCPDEVVGFFADLGRRDKVCFTWDVQNMWQAGTFPTLEVWRRLEPLTGYYHVKGGQSDRDGGEMRWASALEDASWPVAEITAAVVAGGGVDVICLNPSHGQAKDGYNYADVARRDLAFMRRTIAGVE